MPSLCAPANWDFKRDSGESFLSQREMPLMSRVDGPSVVPGKTVALAKTYRQACQLSWAMRKRKGMTAKTLAEEAGMYQSHVSEYLSDDETKREMPARFIPAFEAITGNCAVSQWLALQAQLTVMEQTIADNRRAA